MPRGSCSFPVHGGLPAWNLRLLGASRGESLHELRARSGGAIAHGVQMKEDPPPACALRIRSCSPDPGHQGEAKRCAPGAVRGFS